MEGNAAYSIIGNNEDARGGKKEESQMPSVIRKWLKQEEGQGLVEYSLIIAMVHKILVAASEIV